MVHVTGPEQRCWSRFSEFFRFRFLGQIQTTYFLPGCDLTLLSCTYHPVQSISSAFLRLSKASRWCFIRQGDRALRSASISSHWLRPRDFLTLNKATISKLECDFRGSLHTMDHLYHTNIGRKALCSYSIVPEQIAQ